MSKIHGTTVHVLRDMDLGGLLREYIFEYSDGYCTRKPTDIVRIYESDDICGMYVRYRLVDRKAKVGEKVMYYKDGKSDGVVTTCIGYNERFNDCIDVEPYLAKGDDEVTFGFVHGYYRVLEPVEPAETDDDVLTVDETEASKSVLDLLANLARRVTELERKLGEYARKIDGIEADIQNINVDLGTVEANVEMALDDIVTLDERTQPLAAVLSALAKAVKGDE